MKHLVGFVIALLVTIGMNLLDEFVVKFEISQFFIGWVSCMGYCIGRDAYVECKYSR